jgi:hypothetical protein
LVQHRREPQRQPEPKPRLARQAGPLAVAAGPVPQVLAADQEESVADLAPQAVRRRVHFVLRVARRAGPVLLAAEFVQPVGPAPAALVPALEPQAAR